jgi:purine-nucleoside phosphorylase
MQGRKPVSRSARGDADTRQASAYLAGQAELLPRLGIVLGSGFGRTADLVTDAVSIPYATIPGLPISTVPGHDGRCVLGRLYSWPVAMLVGRVHRYEGRTDDETTMAVRAVCALGISTLILTNAAGGLNPAFRVGDLMVIADHINILSLAGHNPLRGPLGTDADSPFVSLRDAYDPRLRSLAHEAASLEGRVLQEGVYAMVGGPSYESPAEVRMLRSLGADAVGMSTAHEVIVARRSGVRVLGLSCITNATAGDLEGQVAHADVLKAADAAVDTFQRLLERFLSLLVAEESRATA